MSSDMRDISHCGANSSVSAIFRLVCIMSSHSICNMVHILSSNISVIMHIEVNKCSSKLLLSAVMLADLRALALYLRSASTRPKSAR